jgi:hypothetical protein
MKRDARLFCFFWPNKEKLRYGLFAAFSVSMVVGAPYAYGQSSQRQNPTPIVDGRVEAVKQAALSVLAASQNPPCPTLSGAGGSSAMQSTAEIERFLRDVDRQNLSEISSLQNLKQNIEKDKKEYEQLKDYCDIGKSIERSFKGEPVPNVDCGFLGANVRAKKASLDRKTATIKENENVFFNSAVEKILKSYLLRRAYVENATFNWRTRDGFSSLNNLNNLDKSLSSAWGRVKAYFEQDSGIPDQALMSSISLIDQKNYSCLVDLQKAMFLEAIPIVEAVAAKGGSSKEIKEAWGALEPHEGWASAMEQAHLGLGQRMRSLTTKERELAVAEAEAERQEQQRQYAIWLSQQPKSPPAVSGSATTPATSPSTPRIDRGRTPVARNSLNLTPGELRALTAFQENVKGRRGYHNMSRFTDEEYINYHRSQKERCLRKKNGLLGWAMILNNCDSDIDIYVRIRNFFYCRDQVPEWRFDERGIMRKVDKSCIESSRLYTE